MEETPGYRAFRRRRNLVDDPGERDERPWWCDLSASERAAWELIGAAESPDWPETPGA